MNNLETFLNTMELVSSNPELLERTRLAAEGTRIFDPGFRSKKHPWMDKTNVRVSEMLTLIPAAQFAREGKRTAVLNFANPLEPGGGVTRGSNSQEEYLCRASNLYSCLIAPGAADYYNRHRMLEEKGEAHSFLGTDALVYTPGVTVIREDCDYVPGQGKNAWQRCMRDWYQVDMITSAAPYFSSRAMVLPSPELKKLMDGRIRNILEAAIEHDVESIVLGAYGCGVFNNPPMVVAETFRKVLSEERYLHAFRDVEFAICRTGAVSENLNAFRTVFAGFSALLST